MKTVVCVETAAVQKCRRDHLVSCDYESSDEATRAVDVKLAEEFADAAEAVDVADFATDDCEQRIQAVKERRSAMGFEK